MIRIGLDAMGGDFAPGAILAGAELAQHSLPEDVQIVLVGDTAIIQKHLEQYPLLKNSADIVHASEVIEMGEHPTKAFSKKQESSIVVGFRLLEQKHINAFASAGNTGAMLVGTTMTVKTLPGVIRPTIAATLPNIHTRQTIVLDAGISPDSKPDVLFQYGLLGSLYAQYVFKITKPRVALLNIGSEPSKGNLVARSAYELMKDNKRYRFIGNIEGNELFTIDKADVIVCDGFIGNIVLKEAEAVYSIAKALKIKDDFLNRFNFEKYGGTPILGVNGNVIIGHGISNETAVKNMLMQTLKIVRAGLTQKIIKAFK